QVHLGLSIVDSDRLRGASIRARGAPLRALARVKDRAPAKPLRQLRRRAVRATHRTMPLLKPGTKDVEHITCPRRAEMPIVPTLRHGRAPLFEKWTSPQDATA